MFEQKSVWDNCFVNNIYKIKGVHFGFIAVPAEHGSERTIPPLKYEYYVCFCTKKEKHFLPNDKKKKVLRKSHIKCTHRSE